MSVVSELSAEAFAAAWGVGYPHVFSGRLLQDNPFTKSSWRITCICGPRGYVMDSRPHLSDLSDPHERIYTALFSTIRTSGDRELGGCLQGAPHRNASYFGASSAMPIALLEMRRRALDAYDLHAFARSRRWGIAASAEEEISLIGGEPDFIEEFLALAGGEQVVREAFLHCAEYPLEFSESSAAFIKRVMKLAGWPT